MVGHRAECREPWGARARASRRAAMPVPFYAAKACSVRPAPHNGPHRGRFGRRPSSCQLQCGQFNLNDKSRSDAVRYGLRPRRGRGLFHARIPGCATRPGAVRRHPCSGCEPLQTTKYSKHTKRNWKRNRLAVLASRLLARERLVRLRHTLRAAGTSVRTDICVVD